MLIELLSSAVCALMASQNEASWRTADFSRPVSTYSIVARDAATGEMGVAVQSHWFSVGPIVPWAEAGIGAVATQSLVKVSYGPEGLALMRNGGSAEDVLKQLLAQDEGKDVRQVAMIDAQGRVAAHTGTRCIQFAGHKIGIASDGSVYSVQANLMRRDLVPRVMSEAFENAPAGTKLAERMLLALEAAERVGGDVRGKQSAAMLVVRAEATGRSWEDRVVDLRIEDHADPIVELGRLLKLHRAYEQMNLGDLAMEKGDVEGALKAYSAARELAPGHHEMTFWTAVSLVNAERVDEALPLFAEAFQDEKGDWRRVLMNLPASGLLPNNADLMERILNARVP